MQYGSGGACLVVVEGQERTAIAQRMAVRMQCLAGALAPFRVDKPSDNVFLSSPRLLKRALLLDSPLAALLLGLFGSCSTVLKPDLDGIETQFEFISQCLFLVVLWPTLRFEHLLDTPVRAPPHPLISCSLPRDAWTGRGRCWCACACTLPAEQTKDIITGDPRCVRVSYGQTSYLKRSYFHGVGRKERSD